MAKVCYELAFLTNTFSWLKKKEKNTFLQVFWDDNMRDFSIMHLLGSNKIIFSISVEKELEILLCLMH